MSIQSPPILQNYLLSETQRTAALARGSDVAVTAGAGTGKTRTLVARYLALLADGVPLRQIVAVTFTRKAAREMRNRVRQEIGDYLSQTDLSPNDDQKWRRYYNELDAARIGTIHNLCGEILRAHPAEAKIDPRFTVLDETQSALLVQETVEATLAWAVEAGELSPLFDLLRERPLQELIAALLAKRLTVQGTINQIPADTILDNWQTQLQAAQTAALEQLLIDPDFSKALRFLQMNQASTPDDKREIQRQAALAALTFPQDASLTDKLHSLIALDSIKLVGGSQKNWPGGKEQLDEVKVALKCLREMYRQRPLLTQSLNEQDETIAAAMPAIYRLFQYAQQTYQARKSEREALDFDDLEALAIHLLATYPDMRAHWQKQIRAMLVDEFQDTNEHQRQFIRLLCPDAGKLFIVGDAKQSIYRFRGVDVTVFATEKSRIERENGNLLDLDTSYRAHEHLLDSMNHLLHPVLGDDLPHRPPWVAPFAPLKLGTKTVKHNLSAPFVEFHLTLGNKQDALPRAAAALTTRLIHLHEQNGLDYGDMAILCRASNAFQYYEDALDQAGIPYLTVAGKGFYNRPEIRDLLNALQAIADPHDDLALTGLLRSPACGLSDVTLFQLRTEQPATGSLWDSLQEDTQWVDDDERGKLQTAVSLIHDLHQQAGRIPAADIFKQFLDRTYYRAILRRIDQPRALRNIAKLLSDIHGSELVNIAEFLEYAHTLRDSGSREGEARATTGGAVQIMSIHAAKGLEFQIVVLGDASSVSNRTGGILIDPNLGILLPTKNEGKLQAASYQLGTALAQDQDEAEAARLLYVALTRAEQMLLISGTVQQNKSGKLSWKGWLKQLADIVGIVDADLSSYDETGTKQHILDYTLQETVVQAAIYEPNFTASTMPQSSVAGEVEVEAERPSPSPLQEPVIEKISPELSDEATPQRVWQVVPTARRPEAPAWVVGSIVHQALALWRFPGLDFDVWVTARAREYGLADPQQLQHARTETTRLLQRFQQHALFEEVETAEKRLHEVPYSYQLNGTTEAGYIDLLYFSEGQWKIVDFKTDRIQDEMALQQLLSKKDYLQQLQRYGTAVQQLLGITPELLFCFLNFGDEIRMATSIMAS